ncbi:MAG: hypothetical protein M1820_002544 [Bogoriella megaspora]|nr:MAG: hypothetical protein M1820_002544 [Bogoriella megaspora]
MNTDFSDSQHSNNEPDNAKSGIQAAGAIDSIIGNSETELSDPDIARAGGHQPEDKKGSPQQFSGTGGGAVDDLDVGRSGLTAFDSANGDPTLDENSLNRELGNQAAGDILSIIADPSRRSDREDGVKDETFGEATAVPHSEGLSPNIDPGAQSKNVLSGAVFAGAVTSMSALRGSEPGLVLVPAGSGLASISINGPAVIVGGRTISAISDGIVVDGTTRRFNEEAPHSLTGIAKAILEGLAEGGMATDVGSQMARFAISGITYSAFEIDKASDVFISMGSVTATLRAGGQPITLDGRVLSADAQGLIVDGKTSTWAAAVSAATDLAVPFTLSGSVYTASVVDVQGHGEGIIFSGPSDPITLWPGGPDTTIGGEVISAASSGLVVDGNIEHSVAITVNKTETRLSTSYSGSGATSSATATGETSAASSATATTTMCSWILILYAFLVSSKLF